MKYFKSFLLASVFSSVLIPASLSAVTPDELADHIVRSRSCPVASIVDQEPPAKSGWFSSFRQKTGNFLRGLGDELRTESKPQTAAGRVTQMAKDGLVKALSYMTGISLNKEILNPLGNALRTVGQWIKGGEETQTTTRVVLNNLGLNKSSKERFIAEALSTVATASLKAGATTTYDDVVLGLNKRGLSTKNLDTEDIYLSALARKTLVDNPALLKNSDELYEKFSQKMFIHGMPVLEKINGIKGAADGEKLNLMNTYLRQVFKTESAKIKFDAARNSAAAAAAA